MKNLVLILIASLSMVSGVIAQDDMDNNPKVKEMRKEFYNKELQFTPAEEKAFWPLYEEYQKEEKQLRKKFRADDKIALMDDAQAEEHIQQRFEYDKQRTALKEKYFDKFTDVLPVRKVALLEETERKFKIVILKKIKENRSRNK